MDELTNRELRKICFMKETDHMIAEFTALNIEGRAEDSAVVKAAWEAKKQEIRDRYPLDEV